MLAPTHHASASHSSEAPVPGGPFNIQARSRLIRAAAMGLCIGIALAFHLHFADDRIRRPEEMELHLGIPVLAVVPRIDERQPSVRALLSHSKPLSPEAEAFRTVRASLALSPHAKDIRELMVTSANPEAGKSLVSSNQRNFTFYPRNLIFCQRNLKH